MVFPILSNTHQAHFEQYAYNRGICFQDTVYLSYCVRKEKIVSISLMLIYSTFVNLKVLMEEKSINMSLLTLLACVRNHEKLFFQCISQRKILSQRGNYYRAGEFENWDCCVPLCQKIALLLLIPVSRPWLLISHSTIVTLKQKKSKS